MRIKLKKGTFKISENNFLEIQNDQLIEKGLYKVEGENGSGKTIFLEYITGLKNSKNISTKINRKKILYLGEVGIGIEDLTILENIKLVYWIFGIKLDSTAMNLIKELYSCEQLNTVYSQSSFGMQSMVGLSLLFTDYEWQLIVIDETLSGIDKNNKEIILNEIKNKKDTSIIFFVSHEKFEENINYKKVCIHDKKIYFN